MERICVAIRVKPPSRQEAGNGTQWKVVENTISLHNAFGTPIKGQTYSFDTIFETGARNADIYNEHAKDLVLSAVSGFNGTVFAYGQTSSGKTYTMQGSGADPGVTRLAIRDVFTNIEQIEDREFLIRVSYMEIYNEEINDLLAPENRKLQIHESIERGIFVAGLREEIVDSLEQVIAVLERGEAQRSFGETNMNVNSSRSHTIFRMVIESRDKSHDSRLDSDPGTQDAVRVSALNMVDLAGSERISKTGAGGVRLKEGAHINKSLTTLGIVINKLSEGGGKQGAHIPYRDSKLTRILQSALGGNAKTAVICTINPDEIHIDETRGTLQFASRAKRVTNCAQVNEILTDAALLKRQKREIEDLRRRLQGSPHSEDLEKEILHLRNDLLKFELERERLELELQEEKKAQVERERRIKEQEQRIENLSTLVISGAMEDRDLPNKKGSRRETWCPRVSNSDSLDQGFRRILRGMDDFSVSASFDASLRPVASRRDRTFGLPPAFESLVDDESDSFWSNASGVENSPALSDFKNIADEDTWASLNKGTSDFANVADEDTWASLNGGHVNIETRFSNAISDIERRQGSRQAQSSLVNEDSNKVSMLEQQLKETKLQYEELEKSMELKIQEGIKEVIAARNPMHHSNSLLEEQSKLQDDFVPQGVSSHLTAEGLYPGEGEVELRELKLELENCKQQNCQMQAEIVKLHDQLLHTMAALEQGAQERVSMDEENKFFRERLHSLEMGIQDDLHQQSDRSSYLEDDFTQGLLEVTESSALCLVCLSSMDKAVEESSIMDGDVDRERVFGNFLTESQEFQKFEISLPKVNKRRLFNENGVHLQADPDKHEAEKGQGCDGFSKGFEVESDLQKNTTVRYNGIFAALSGLCCRIKQLADPAAQKMSDRKEPRQYQEPKDLKLSLTIANTLASQLLEELHYIVNHDIRCLDSHLASKGAVGRNLMALQLLLLENADVALCLFCDLFPKDTLLMPKKLQQLLQEALGAVMSVTDESVQNLDKGGHGSDPIKESGVEIGEENVLLTLPNEITGAVQISNKSLKMYKKSLETEKDLLENGDGSGFIERIKMSGEHISSLDSELALQSLEHQRISKTLIEQLNVNHESMKAMKAEKLRLARDLENYMGALAVHDEVVAAICAEIKEFEKEVGMKREEPFQTECASERGRLLENQFTCPTSEQRADSNNSNHVEIENQEPLEQGWRELSQAHSSKQLFNTIFAVVLHNKKLSLEKSVSFTESKLVDANEEIEQLRRSIEETPYSCHISCTSCPSIGHSDSWHGNGNKELHYSRLVGESQSMDEDTMMISQDSEEDLCNLDLQPGMEQELGVASNGLSDLSLDQGSNGQNDSEYNAGAFGVLDDDNSLAELRILTNMSEAEKQFTRELLRKVKALEARLTVAEMEVVEYKVEVEHLKVNNLRASEEAPLRIDDWEIQSLRAECEIQKEEIRQLMEQVMTPDAELERESRFQETVERNNFLEHYLKKAERRLIRAKGWREEVLKIRETEKLRETSYCDLQARIARLEREGVILRQALLKAQRLQTVVATKVDHTDRQRDRESESEVFSEVQNVDIQRKFEIHSKKQEGLPPLSRSLCSTLQPSPNPSSHARGLYPRPPRAALGEVNKNSLKMLHSSFPKDSKPFFHNQKCQSRGPASDISNKENDPRFMDYFTESF